MLGRSERVCLRVGWGSRVRYRLLRCWCRIDRLLRRWLWVHRSWVHRCGLDWSRRVCSECVELCHLRADLVYSCLSLCTESLELSDLLCVFKLKSGDTLLILYERLTKRLNEPIQSYCYTVDRAL